MTVAAPRYGQTIAIVGAGAAGTLVAIELLRQSQTAGTRVDIRLIDPSATTGRGLAYSTPDLTHLLNVPAGRMSALADDPSHFIAWLGKTHDLSDAGAFVPRSWYGDYLEDTLAEAIAASSSTLTRIHEEVVEVHDRGSDYTLRLSGGSRFRASSIVLALGSPRAAQTWVPLGLAASDRFVADPWDRDALLRTTAGARDVLIVGTGLTMVDIALSLRESGCSMRAISRTGLLPESHVPAASGLDVPELPEGQLSLTQVRALVAEQVRRANDAGLTWRAGVDSLRPITDDIWARMTPVDQQTFLRTEMRAWEVARHRTAPQIGRVLDDLLDTGRLRVNAGAVADAHDSSDRLLVTLDTGEHLTVDAVVDCTGPATVGAAAGVGGMLVANLVTEGIVDVHRLNLGLQVDRSGHPLDPYGRPRANLIVVGPLRRGTAWETTAIPEIRQQAAAAAADLLVQQPESGRGRVEDLYGQSLSADADVADLYNEALGRILRVQSGALEALNEAVGRDPGFALGHAALAVLGHEFGANVDIDAHLRAAATGRGSDREKAFVEAYSRRTVGDSSALLAYTAEHPRDVLALSVAMPTIAFSGAYDVQSEAWSHLEAAAEHFGDDWWFTGLLAFARQEQGRMSEAAELADHSLSLEPRGGNAVHARAHVYFETGEHAAGLAWLDPWIETGGRDAVHRAHFSWHAAMHELALDDTTAVIRRYHSQLAPPAVVGTRALVDSASLLWRCQLERVEAPDPWPVLRAAGPELDRPETPFAAMHAAVAWASAGERDGLRSLRAHCSQDPRDLMNSVVVDFIDALDAYLAGDFDQAANTMLALHPRMAPIGGSDAQREVVLDTAIAALIQANRGLEAGELLELRMSRRPRPRDRVLHARAAATIPT